MKNQEKKTQEGKHHYLKILGIVLAGITFFTVINNLPKVQSAFGLVMGVLSPLIIGLCIAFVLNIPLRFFENKLFRKLTRKNGKIWSKVKRPLCIFLSILLLLSIITLLLTFIIPGFVEACISFFLTLPDNMNKINLFIKDIAANTNLPIDTNAIDIDWDSLSAKVLQFLADNSKNIASSALTLILEVFSTIVNVIIGFIFSIYVLASKEALGKLVKSFIYSVMDRARARKLISVVMLSNKAFVGFVTGQCIEVALIGVLCFIGMLIFQFPNALMVSCIIAITAFIPVFGAIIGGAIGAVLIFITDPVKALWFAVFLIILQQVESNVLYPKFMGKQVGLPGIWVLTAVTIGGGLFGVAGIIISVPLCSVLYTLFDRWIIKRLEQRNICHRTMSHDSSEPKSIIEEITTFEFEEAFSDDMYKSIISDEVTENIEE